MATRYYSFVVALHLTLMNILFGMVVGAAAPASRGPIEANDKDLIQVALNLEFLETEFFLNGALGRGLDSIEPEMAAGGPPPTGASKANLDHTTYRIIEEFGYQEIGHLRAIVTTLVTNSLLHSTLIPTLFNYLLASYVIPYVGLVGYVGTIPNLVNCTSRSLVAGLLGVESGQDAVIRTLLYERADQIVVPYKMTVAEFTDRISALRNRLGMRGNKDEGLRVPRRLGAENRTDSNILSANANSLSYSRTPPEILRIVYGTGSENKPGGFFPNGGNGAVAKRFLAAL
ncbi:hypothetical protein CUMW_055430 [Citrus unshiu]|nr:hypothetical protein CUMW_055430 [Citrus unshiu]